jgi:hypothetical protein
VGKHRNATLVVSIISLLVVATPWWYAFIAAPLLKERRIELHRHDWQVTTDLNAIAEAIDQNVPYTTQPVTSLDELRDSAYIRAKGTDLRLSEYEYRATGPDTYQLCANFQHSSANQDGVLVPHDSGRACFNLQVRGRR